MATPVNIPVILAIVFFVLPIAVKLRRKQKIELSDLTRCTLTAMGLPSLTICLYYLVTNPLEAMKMPEAPQYLAIAVLTITYLAIEEIKKALDNPKTTPEK